MGSVLKVYKSDAGEGWKRSVGISCEKLSFKEGQENKKYPASNKMKKSQLDWSHIT
jgi:hypothetical protein